MLGVRVYRVHMGVSENRGPFFGVLIIGIRYYIRVPHFRKLPYIGFLGLIVFIGLRGFRV